jgi:hypothetical protein
MAFLYSGRSASWIARRWFSILSGENVSTLSRDVERWRLRAEQYRAIADISPRRSMRNAYLAMAEQYDRIADDADCVAPPRRLMVDDCLYYAQQCHELAGKLSSDVERLRLLEVAEQWLVLARRGDT